MARKRMIDPNFWTSEDVSKLSMTARYIFLGMISCADDEGRGRANVNYLKSVIFPYDDIRTAEIDKALSEISHNTSVVLYDCAGNKYYAFKNWDKWQRVDHPQTSIMPAPPDLQDNSGIIPESFANDSRGTPPNIIKVNIIKDNISKEPKGSTSTPKVDAVSEVVDFYNLHRRTLPEAITLSDKRKGFINARLEKYGIEKVKQAILNAELSDFLNRGGDKAWAADIDWIMRPNNFPNVLEGKYKNKEQQEKKDANKNTPQAGNFQQRKHTEIDYEAAYWQPPKDEKPPGPDAEIYTTLQDIAKNIGTKI